MSAFFSKASRSIAATDLTLIPNHGSGVCTWFPASGSRRFTWAMRREMYNSAVEIDIQALHRELVLVRDELDHVARKLQAYGADLEIERLRRKVVTASEKIRKLVGQLR